MDPLAQHIAAIPTGGTAAHTVTANTPKIADDTPNKTDKSLWFLYKQLLSAPCSTKNLTTSSLPLSDAKDKGVSPLLLALLILKNGIFLRSFLVRLSKFIIIYGKRRLVFCLLFSFILGSMIREIPIHLMDIYDVESLFALSQIEELNFTQYFIVKLGYWLTEFTSSDMVYIGYLIPGLMASWMDKQGVITTSSIILIISSPR